MADLVAREEFMVVDDLRVRVTIAISRPSREPSGGALQRAFDVGVSVAEAAREAAQGKRRGNIV